MRKLVLAGLVAAGVVAYRRLTASTSGPASSGPTLASVPDATGESRPATSHLHPVPSGPQSGAPADSPAEVVFPGDDQGGSSPDEAAADLASEAEKHAVTLPDQPLEEVDLTEVPDPEVPARD